MSVLSKSTSSLSRISWLCAVLFFACSLVANAQEANPGSAAELDAAAATAYRETDYDSARERWTTALNSPELAQSSQERARILHNLGNVAMRKGDPLRAVALYRASLKLRPRDVDTLANFDLARTDANLDPAGRSSFFASLTKGESERLVMLMTLVLFIALLAEALFGRAFRGVVMIVGVLLLLAMVPWVGTLSDGESREVMVVKKSGSPLRSEPRTGAKTLVRLNPGTEHRVRDEHLDWVAVETPDGIAGWLPKDHTLSTTR